MDTMSDKAPDNPEAPPTGGSTAKPARSAASKQQDGALRRTKSKSYKNVFKGSVLVSTLMDHDTSRFADRAAAVRFAQKLLDASHIESIVGASEFEDSVHLFRWSDETVVREAKKMVNTLSSHIPRKKLIELVDLHKGDGGEEAYVMCDVRQRITDHARQDATTARAAQRTRGHRRQTLDSSQLAEFQEHDGESGLALSNSASSENLVAPDLVPSRLRRGSITSSNELLTFSRRSSSQSISDTCQTDTEKVRSPERVRSPEALRSPTRVTSPEPSDVATDPLSPQPVVTESQARADAASYAESQAETNGGDNSVEDSSVFHEDDALSTVRYDGVDMPALDLENLDFDSVRSRSCAADALSVLDPSLESLSEAGNCYSDNEKQLLEQLRRMQQEHANVVTGYERHINNLVGKMGDLKQLAELLQKEQQAQEEASKAESTTSTTSSTSTTAHTCLASTANSSSGAGGPRMPAPPPPPPPLFSQHAQRLVKPSKSAIKPRVKMRPLFWNRIIIERQKPQDKEKTGIQFWITATEPNFDVDEFERYFGKNVEEDNPRVRSLHDSMAAAKGRAAKKECAKLLDESRSQAVAIKLRSLHCQMVDIQKALHNMDFSQVDTDSLFSLYEIRGTKEELDKIHTHMQANENVPLDEPELFLWELSILSHFPERVECLMLRKRFNETLFDIDQQLCQVRAACEALSNNDHLRLVLEVVLAFGNYMNGGTQRGQADGFELSILPKLKDVKSMDNNLNLLHYLVRVCTREYEEDAGRNEAVFRLPDPTLLNQASQVSFNDLAADLTMLAYQIATNAKKAELVYMDTEPGLLQPFKDQMDDFFESAEDMLRSQKAKLEEVKSKFQSLLRYLAVKDATEQVVPETFFGMWYRFVEDYRNYWVMEQKRIAKQMFEKVEQRRKARLRSAKRRKSEVDSSGKANMKQKFEEMRRRSENQPASAHCVRVLRSQSTTSDAPDKLAVDNNRHSGPPFIEERPRRRRRQTSEVFDASSKDGAAGGPRDATAGPVPEGNVSPNETMAQRMQRRRRTRVASGDNEAPGGQTLARPRSQCENMSWQQTSERPSRIDPASPETTDDPAAIRRRSRAHSSDTKSSSVHDVTTADAEVTSSRRRRSGRQEAPSSEVTTEGNSFASRRQLYREQREHSACSDSEGVASRRQPRLRNSPQDVTEGATTTRPARELMRRFTDRGQEAK